MVLSFFIFIFVVDGCIRIILLLLSKIIKKNAFTMNIENDQNSKKKLILQKSNLRNDKRFGLIFFVQ